MKVALSTYTYVGDT